ncbi:MAG: hypothetical protein AB1454_02575 [Candidatus Auribacterota bacterium]
MRNNVLPLFFVISVILFTSINSYAFEMDVVIWPYNLTNMPGGNQMVSGTGIDSSNGYYVSGAHTPWWQPIDFFPTEIVMRRDLLAGSVTTYFNSSVIYSIVVEYIPGSEDAIGIEILSSYFHTNLKLLSTEIRYHNDEEWDNWQSIDFSYTFSSSGQTEYTHYETQHQGPFALRTTTYDAYEVRAIISSSYPAALEWDIYSYNDLSNNFNPLSSNVPEPLSLTLLITAIIVFITRKA